MITYHIDRCGPLKSEVRCFINAVRTGEPPHVTAVDGMAALALAEALIESSRLQEPIRLNGNGHFPFVGDGAAALPVWPYVSNAVPT